MAGHLQFVSLKVTINRFEICEMHKRANCLRKVGVVHNYLLRTPHERASPNSLAMPEALPYFERRSLILAPNIKQGKRFCSVLVCCTGSVVYLAGRQEKKS